VGANMPSAENQIYSLDTKEWGNIAGSLDYVMNKQFDVDCQMLDIGCNSGSLIFNLRRHSYNKVYGIDTSQSAINRGKEQYGELRENLIWYEGDLLPFQDNRFDVVMMFDVIEHIKNVQKFLSDEVWRVLKPDGIFIFQTPNKLTNVPWEIISTKSLTGYKAYHVSLQTYKSLYRLLCCAGYKNIVIEKNDVTSDYYLRQIQPYLGPLSNVALLILDRMPIILTTNFW